MPRDSAAADRPASYLVGTAAAFPLFFRDRTKPINQLPFSPSARFPKSGSSCESRVRLSNSSTVQGDLPKQYYDAMDPFVVLAAASQVAKKIKLGTGVLLVQQRDAIQTAKLVASIDQVSQGRSHCF